MACQPCHWVLSGMVFFFCILQKAFMKAEAAGCTPSRLQHHHSEGVCAVDGVLPCSCPEDAAPSCLQTGWHWPHTPWRSWGNRFWKSSDLCSSRSQNPFSSSTSPDWELGTPTSSRLTLHPPGQAGERCDSRVVWLLQRVRHHLWQQCGWMVCRCPELPVWQTTLCSLTTLCVRQRGSAVAGRQTVSLPQRLSGAWAGCISDTVGGNSVTWCDQSCAQLDVTGTEELIWRREKDSEVPVGAWLVLLLSIPLLCLQDPPSLLEWPACTCRHSTRWGRWSQSHRSSHRNAAEVGVFSEAVGLPAVEFGLTLT